MKKKIIISGILIIFISVILLFINKKGEASTVFVPIEDVANYSVGDYIHLDTNGDMETYKISSMDINNGMLIIDFISDIDEVSKSGVTLTAPVYEVSQGSGDGCTSKYEVNYNPQDGQAESDYARSQSIVQGCENLLNDSATEAQHISYCTVEHRTEFPTVAYWGTIAYTVGCVDGVNTAPVDNYTYDPNGGALGGVYTGTINGESLSFYEYYEDVPLLPTCFDGIQNQDETGIDCGGVCEINFGLVCPPEETCFDGIMNQDETGIDYGGVCGIGGDPSPAGPEPTNFTDVNVDGIDDISGYDSVGNVPIGAPGEGDSSTYDSSLPGNISEVGETNWTGLITGYLSSNPLVLLATGSSINLSGEVCTLTANVFGTDIVIDFCSMESMIDLIGTFVLGLMAIRSVFIAMGI